MHYFIFNFPMEVCDSWYSVYLFIFLLSLSVILLGLVDPTEKPDDLLVFFWAALTEILFKAVTERHLKQEPKLIQK